MKFQTIITLAILVFIGTLLILNFKMVGYALTSSFFNPKPTVLTASSTDRPPIIISDQKVYLLPVVGAPSSAVTSAFVSRSNSYPPRSDSTIRSVQNIQPAAPLLSSVLEIPALNVSVPIVFQNSISEAAVYKSLKSGVVHFATTPKPGEHGASIMLGHSSSPPWSPGKYDTIFAGLDRLKAGDTISIRQGDQTLNYKVTSSLTFSPKNADEYQLKELEATPTSSIILMSCWPVGTNYKRIAVRADIV